jgi:UDP-N-acetylglucosamine 2-epimerase
MKLLSIIGTRPNFIKEYLIHTNASKYGIEEVVVHTGQHYDENMSGHFLSDFNINVDYFLDIRSKSHCKQIAEMIVGIEDVINKEEPDATLIYGDVNSTMAGAIASSKNSIPVIHYEGGIRTSLTFNPEEINRRVSDIVSNLIFCVTKDGVETLKEENYNEENIIFSGDLHKDLLELILKTKKISIEDHNYIVCTIHRAETTDNKHHLEAIVNSLLKSEYRVIIPLHPRTKKALQRFNLLEKFISGKNIEIVDPLNYINFVELLSKSSKVVTDSGGVRREGFLLNKPVINFSNIIWFREIINAGYKYVAYYNEEKIIQAINSFTPIAKKHFNVFGDGNAYKIVLQEIKERFG